MIFVEPGQGMMGGVRQDASSMQTLKQADYQALLDQSEYLSDVTPIVNASGQAIYGTNNTPTSVSGVNTSYLNIRKYTIGEGDMFTDQDIKAAAKVCVIGKTVVTNLFTNGEDPVGKVIRFKNIPMRVVGVLTEKGNNSMSTKKKLQQKVHIKPLSLTVTLPCRCFLCCGRKL